MHMYNSFSCIAETNIINQLCFIDYAKAFGCVDHNKLWKILKDDTVKVLHSVCQQIWKTQQWPQDWKRSVFTPIPKKGNAKECSNYCTHLTC